MYYCDIATKLSHTIPVALLTFSTFSSTHKQTWILSLVHKGIPTGSHVPQQIQANDRESVYLPNLFGVWCVCVSVYTGGGGRSERRLSQNQSLCCLVQRWRSEREATAECWLLGWLGVPFTTGPLLLPFFHCILRYLSVCCTLYEGKGEHKTEVFLAAKQQQKLYFRPTNWNLYANLELLLLFPCLFHYRGKQHFLRLVYDIKPGDNAPDFGVRYLE